MRDWGALNVSKEGYVFWTRGTIWFSLCQFRDNILLSCNLNPGSETSLVHEVCSTLSEIWKLEVLCDCLDSGQAVCTGRCLSNTVRALGISMTVGVGAGLGSTHPAALNADRSLRHGMPLITPSRAPHPYLPCILISSPTAALPWQHKWAAHIMSALAWV